MMDYDKLLCMERIRDYKKGFKNTDRRSEFEKDYHRIIGSASFRRLQDKTQVFALDSSDFIRTRLTHSLEVSSIAKSLGQTGGALLKEKGIVTDEQVGYMTDILLCAGLLHDIGNPPFGHFGEAVIRDWFRENLDVITYKGKPLSGYLSDVQKADLCNFEGNAQSLRVVAKLHHLVDDNGMNLTKGLLNTIIKYPTSSVEIDKKAGDIRLKKMGYFEADSELFQNITHSTGAGNSRHPLTFLLEAADDIAYSTADIEDGYKKGILSFMKLWSILENNQYTGCEPALYADCEYAFDRLRTLYERAKEHGEYDPESYAVLNWTVSMQSRLISVVCNSFVEHQDEILSGDYKVDLFEGTSSHYLIRLLKETSFTHVFQIQPIVRQELSAGTIIKTLLDSFVPAALVFDTDEPKSAVQNKLIRLISPNYVNHYRKQAKAACGEGPGAEDEGERLYLRMILVTDFISGMTDSYAKALYQELMGQL